MSDLKLFNQTINSPESEKYLKQVLGENAKAFISNATALVSNSGALQKCDPYSIMFAAIKATTLDLPLDQSLGLAYVIPYGDKATLQLGYKSYVQLAMRSGQFKTMNVTDVKEGELIGNNMLSGEIEFKMLEPKARVSAKTVGYAAYFRLSNAFEKTLYMSIEEIEAHGKKYSKAYNKMWVENFDAMARKTVLKLLISKYAPLSVEMREATRSDSATFNRDLEPIYIDNPANNLDVEGNDKASDMFAKAMSNQSIQDAVIEDEVVEAKAEVKAEPKKDTKTQKVEAKPTLNL